MGDLPESANESIRTEYTTDKELKASILPTGKSAAAGGGSYGFDANNPTFPQNIIVCEDGIMTRIARIEGGVSASQSIGRDPSPEEVEAFYMAKANQRSPKAEPAAGSSKVAEPDIPTASKREIEMQELPQPTLSVGDPSDATESQPAVKKQTGKPVYILIKGPFGKVRQPFSSIFRDDLYLVLMTDHRQLETSYELPTIEDEPMALEIQINKKSIRCLWAGIQFTLPDNSATFTVLLIQEELNLGEG